MNGQAQWSRYIVKHVDLHSLNGVYLQRKFREYLSLFMQMNDIKYKVEFLEMMNFKEWKLINHQGTQSVTFCLKFGIYTTKLIRYLWYKKIRNKIQSLIIKGQVFNFINKCCFPTLFI